MINRDSFVWWVGIVGAILTAIANEQGVFPPEWKPYIHLGALICGILSGKLASSPLRGKDGQ